MSNMYYGALTLAALTLLLPSCGNHDSDEVEAAESDTITIKPEIVYVDTEESEVVIETRNIDFEFEDGKGTFKQVTLTPLPAGTTLEPGEEYLGEVGGKRLTLNAGVLKLGDQTFPRLPLESIVEVLNHQLIVNGEDWGTILE